MGALPVAVRTLFAELEPIVHVVASKVEGRARAVSATRMAIVVALAHGLTDAYASFIPPLLPRGGESRPMTSSIASFCVTCPV